MIKATPPPQIEDAIRKKAAKQGVPINHFLAPFLEAIANGTLMMVPHFPPPSPSKV